MGIPENSSVVIPRLVCRDVAAAIEFCVNTFGAVDLGSRPGPDGSSPVVIFVYVEDVDKTVERAVAGGATVLIPIQNQFWGDRIGWVIDPSGHVWTIATRIEETSEEERRDRWSRTLSEKTKPTSA